MNKKKFVLLLLHINIHCQIHESFDTNFKFLQQFSGFKNCNSEFYELFNFVKKFFKDHDLEHQLNIEYSIKVSKNTINTKRYTIRIPRPYLNDLENQTNKLMTLVKDDAICNKIKKYMQDHEGAMGYGLDFAKSKNYKVYFDFPKILGKGIDSYEWKKGEKEYTNRTYKPAGLDFQKYLDEILDDNQKDQFDKLKEYLDLSKVLIKENGNKKSLNLGFKADKTINEIKDMFLKLIQKFGKNKQASACIDKIKDSKVSWISLSKDEISLYFRITEWIFYPNSGCCKFLGI